MSDSSWFLSFAWGRAPYALDLPEVVIGRGDHCTLQIEEASASDEHARFLLPDEGGVALEPIVGVTLVNGKAITGRTALQDGDFVQIGASVLTLRSGQAYAQGTAATKNFVVGSTESSGMATLMMESPLVVGAPRREPARTIEANADELMAAIRKANLQTPTARPDQPTIMAARPSSLRPATLLGVGPDADAILAAERTMDLAAAPTQVASRTQPTPGSWRPRATTVNPEHTPLPAPLPPPDVMSVPDLRQLVARATASRDTVDETKTEEVAVLTSQMAALKVKPPVVTLAPRGISDEKTTPPKQSPVFSSTPLAEQKTMLPVQAMQAPVLGTAATQMGAAPAASPATPLSTPRVNAPPTELVKPIDPRARTMSPQPAHSAPQKGPFGSFSRALDFFAQMFELTRSDPTLLKPLYYDLAVATPLMVLVSLMLLFVHSQGAVYAVLFVGTGLLYFVDYFCNALTASLLYDHATTGRTDMSTAMARVKRSLTGIATFAAISALLDVAATYARERHDFVAKIVLRVLHAIWSTATYVIMPAMVIEGVSFKDAFSRSKTLMDRDPTGVGAGIVALSLCSYIIGAVVFTLAFFAMRIGSHVHPLFGVLLFFTFVNLYWAVSGWMKIAYSTCFYLWAQRCQAAGQPDDSLAPAPLRHALASG
ncbi:MAG: FHA domain-containing protein [Polyangia bacterium]